MSWCGGGEINSTPGVVRRMDAMYSLILCPGISPPSPGFAPCAILIWRSLALIMYSVVTPNLPEATCLTAEFRDIGWSNGMYLELSSPPSPVLLLASILFIAMARVSCASRLMEPRDIAPVANRGSIFSIGSTSSIGMGKNLDSSNSSICLSEMYPVGSLSAASSNSRYVLMLFRVDADCRSDMVSGFHMCFSPVVRHA